MVNYNDVYSYEIYDDGYDIYKNDNLVLKQREPYAHVFVGNGTYEENAIAQIKDCIKSEEEQEYVVNDAKKQRADLDYMALMLDVTLPSEEEEL